MRIVARILCILALVTAVATPASAACLGRNLMQELARIDPATHAEILRRGKAIANGRGRFWEIRAPGVAPSYLYGTLHSTEAAARGLPTEAKRALEQARLVMVELTPTEQARLQRRLAEDPSFATARTGPTLSERLTPAQHASAKSVLAARGIPIAAAERLKPWLLVSMIAVPRCEQVEIAAGHPVLDDWIASRARELGIPVRGLESFEETFAAFDELSEPEMTSLLIDGFASAALEEDLRRTLEVLYGAGEIAAITEFNVWFSEQSGNVVDARGGAAALERALIAGRNRIWLDRLIGEIAQGGVFAAFGALHLPGEEGIVTQLRLAGFSIRRLLL